MNDILQQQIAYYRARAGEYDEWFYRKGRYDRGEALNGQWFDEIAFLMGELASVGKVESALELACGTGNWTRELAKISTRVTALDASQEVMEINRQKLGDARVNYQPADLFAWEPDGQYDLVFMAFWMSHVPPEKLDSFLDAVKRATKPGGQVFMIDSLPDDTSTAADHPAYEPERIYHTRKLNDGREFQIVKVFYQAEALTQKLAEHGFTAQINHTERYFWWARGKRP